MHQHLTANRKGALAHHLLMGFSPFPFPNILTLTARGSTLVVKIWRL